MNLCLHVYKFGYKLWVLAKPLGYCVQFCPYAGKDTQLDEYGDIGLGVGGTVVAHLLKCLPSQQDNGSIYHVVMDNFFTFPGILCHLQKQPIAATGTVRLCRMGNPPLKSVKEVKKLQRGTSVVASSDDVSAVRWKDNKVVNILSTFAGKEPQNKVKRYSHNKKKRIDILQPNVVNVYNRFMGEVDRMDQNTSTYMIHLRSKKWWWPLFRFCVDVAINNAFQLYRLRKPDAGELKLDALEFRRAIVEAYYLKCSKNVPQILFPGSRSQPREHVRFSATNHWIVKGTQRRYAKPGYLGTSRYSCGACNVGLHPECFKEYHFQ